MKLSAKIFCCMVGLTLCSMALFAITVRVQTRNSFHETPDVSEFTRMEGFKTIVIGRNWDISLAYSKSEDTIEMHGVRFTNFDPEFVHEAKEYIEIKNDTLRFKDMRKLFSRCVVYVDPLFKEIKISGNSMLTLGRDLELNRLNVNAFDRSYISIHNVSIPDFTITAHDNTRIWGYRDTDSHISFTPIKTMELCDYSNADFRGLFVSNYRVEDHASFILHRNFAVSKTKQISLKEEYVFK